MTNRYDRGRRDQNEPEICAVLKAAHVPYIPLPIGAGADLLILTAPVMSFVEVKNPAQYASDRKLTKSEMILKAFCEDRGIPYYVVETGQGMADVIGKAEG